MSLKEITNIKAKLAMHSKGDSHCVPADCLLQRELCNDMVYTGPSKGCQKCKARHIKCDERKPFCGNCQRANLPCPGYTYIGGIRFQDETPLLVGRGRKNTPSKSNVPPEAAAQSTSVVPLSAMSTLETEAISFFLGNFCHSARVCASTRSWFDLLPAAYDKAGPNSALGLVLATTATEIFLRWTGVRQEPEKVSMQLGDALQAVNRALMDPKLNISDQTLTAVFLLQFHTNVVAHINMEPPAGNHSGGATAIIYHRGRQNFANNLSQRLVQNARYRLIWNALSYRTHLALEEDVWLEDPKSDISPAAQLDRIALELTNVQADFELFKINSIGVTPGSLMPDYDITELDAIRMRAKRVDEQLVNWASAQKGLNCFVSMSGSGLATPSLQQAGVYEDLWDVYPSVQVADMWNNYRSYRLIALKVLGQCNSLVSQMTLRIGIEDSFEGYETDADLGKAIREVVDGLCASVPYSLGNRISPFTKADFDDLASAPYLLPEVESEDFWRPTTAQRARSSMLTREQHIRQLMCEGPWYLVFHLDLAFRLCSAEDESQVIAHHLRPGQISFIEKQIFRCNILHRLGSPARQRQPSETPK